MALFSWENHKWLIKKAIQNTKIIQLHSNHALIKETKVLIASHAKSKYSFDFFSMEDFSSPHKKLMQRSLSRIMFLNVFLKLIRA